MPEVLWSRIEKRKTDTFAEQFLQSQKERKKNLSQSNPPSTDSWLMAAIAFKSDFKGSLAAGSEERKIVQKEEWRA